MTANETKLRMMVQTFIDRSDALRAALERGDLAGTVDDLTKTADKARTLLTRVHVPDEWLNAAQIARELNLNTETVYRWIRSGDLVTQTVGTRERPRHRINRRELDAFLQKRGEFSD